MTASLLPNGEQQFIDQDGAPFASGFVYFYVPNTLLFKDTYQDSSGTILNTNPIVLNAQGCCTALGNGDYRQILKDADGVLIWDKMTSAPLPGDAISEAMAPIVAASTVAQARMLLGVDAFVQAAISNIELTPGPPGNTGGIGPTGPTGPQGPPASTGITVKTSNPGYYSDSISGFTMQFGTGATDGTGGATVIFPLTFTNLLSITATPWGTAVNPTCKTTSRNATGFGVFIETVGYTPVAVNFDWIASGFVFA